ncbi:tail fiber assembly protein [Pseudomonas helleri]|uniref:tail fiber assembly protein n=1 Tax=Pseudomonas helleri TaxID=1608996 RepID=UPI0030DB77D6
MTTRAAINILGATGAIIDITSLGVSTIESRRNSLGAYQLKGTKGMAKAPEGWGYVVNQMDSDKNVAITYANELLEVAVTLDGEPADLQHSLTLHVAVDELPPQIVPEPAPLPPADPAQEVQAQIAQLRAIADYAITPLQDAVDIDEATEEDTVQLKAWKKYRVALNRVPEQVGYPETIDWPTVPY